MYFWIKILPCVGSMCDDILPKILLSDIKYEAISFPVDKIPFVDLIMCFMGILNHIYNNLIKNHSIEQYP